MFRFATPEYLYLLLLLPLLLLLFVWSLYQRRKALERFGEVSTLMELMPELSSWRVKFKFLLLLLAFTALIFALARPQFGSKLREVTREGVEIMLAVDVSNSMLAEDFQPNRLERTKFAIDRLVEQLHEDQLGLIVFAGDAYVQLPITSDYVTARTFASSISPDMVSRQGTALGAAITLATQSFSSGSEDSRALILISDGENHEDDPLAAAKAAAERGVTIYTIGIGTPEGAPIQMGGDFLKDEQGEMVVSKLDEEVLRQIALTTGGSYVRATNRSLGLEEVISQINKMQKRELSTSRYDEFNEQYQYLIAIALLLLLIERGLLPRRSRIFSRLTIFK